MGRPHKDQSTADIHTAIRSLSRQAGEMAATGPKRLEDAAHDTVNSLLDELDHRTRENRS